jgi:peptidoglycan/xylan/chitin deacetylase (PgdA/CDA1 family)
MRIAVLAAARALGLFAAARWLTRGQQRILCYHGIWTGPSPHYGDCLFMSPGRFADRMAWLQRSGYRVIPLQVACERMAARHVDARDVVITIDDAWAGIAQHMLPVLRRHAMPATLYVTTYYALAQRPVLNVLVGYLVERGSLKPDPASLDLPADLPRERLSAVLAERVDALPDLASRWTEVERLAQAFGVDLEVLKRHGSFMLMGASQLKQARDMGVDVQLHTHTHRLHDYSAEHVQRELDLNRQHLARILQRPASELRHFCYPSGEYVPSLFPILRAAGIASATTTEAGLNKPGAEPLALARILDCESLEDIELEARLSGFWGVLSSLRLAFRRRATSAAAPVRSAPVAPSSRPSADGG